MTYINTLYFVFTLKVYSYFVSLQYNFDFRSEVPLDGDWVWERVSPSDDPPSQESTQPKDLQTNVPRDQPEERQDQPAVLQDQPGVDLEHPPTK